MDSIDINLEEYDGSVIKVDEKCNRISIEVVSGKRLDDINFVFSENVKVERIEIKPDYNYYTSDFVNLEGDGEKFFSLFKNTPNWTFKNCKPDVSNLKKIRIVKELVFDSCELLDEDLILMTKCLPSPSRLLRIENCPQITDISCLKAFKDISELKLNNNGIKKGVKEILSSLEKLFVVELNNNLISDDQFEEIKIVGGKEKRYFSIELDGNPIYKFEPFKKFIRERKFFTLMLRLNDTMIDDIEFNGRHMQILKELKSLSGHIGQSGISLGQSVDGYMEEEKKRCRELYQKILKDILGSYTHKKFIDEIEKNFVFPNGDMSQYNNVRVYHTVLRMAGIFRLCYIDYSSSGKLGKKEYYIQSEHGIKKLNMDENVQEDEICILNTNGEVKNAGFLSEELRKEFIETLPEKLPNNVFLQFEDETKITLIMLPKDIKDLRKIKIDETQKSRNLNMEGLSGGFKLMFVKNDGSKVVLETPENGDVELKGYKEKNIETLKTLINSQFFYFENGKNADLVIGDFNNTLKKPEDISLDEVINIFENYLPVDKKEIPVEKENQGLDTLIPEVDLSNPIKILMYGDELQRKFSDVSKKISDDSMKVSMNDINRINKLTKDCKKKYKGAIKRILVREELKLIEERLRQQVEILLQNLDFFYSTELIAQEWHEKFNKYINVAKEVSKTEANINKSLRKNLEERIRSLEESRDISRTIPSISRIHIDSNENLIKTLLHNLGSAIPSLYLSYSAETGLSNELNGNDKNRQILIEEGTKNRSNQENELARKIAMPIVIENKPIVIEER